MKSHLNKCIYTGKLVKDPDSKIVVNKCLKECQCILTAFAKAIDYPVSSKELEVFLI